MEATTTARIIRSDVQAADAQPGSIVSYEDIANPCTFFTITALVSDAWGTQAVMVNHRTGEITTSSLRGAGWKMAEVMG